MFLFFWRTITHFSAVACGYWLCVAVQRYRTRERERVLRALGGQLPDWELAARKIENDATEHIARLRTATADELFRQADTIRARGRKRDKEWR